MVSISVIGTTGLVELEHQTSSAEIISSFETSSSATSFWLSLRSLSIRLLVMPESSSFPSLGVIIFPSLTIKILLADPSVILFLKQVASHTYLALQHSFLIKHSQVKKCF